MDEKQVKINQSTSWEYVPDSDTLLEYLDRVDLVELSKCCKSYRNQLNNRIFENLSLGTWKNNNRDAYSELIKSCRLEKTLEFLKTDLDTKLKFVNSFTLNCEVDCDFAEVFVKLFPNIKALFIHGCGVCVCLCSGFSCDLKEGLVTILKGMKRLEHLYLDYIQRYAFYWIVEEQFIPKSIKSLEFGSTGSYDSYDNGVDNCIIYDNIYSSYINLYSLTIISNRMLQNLSFGMPNLQEVEISEYDSLDQSKILEFLRANPQLKKLNIGYIDYNKEILKTILSYRYLEHLSICSVYWEGIEVNDLPPNYSIKYLQISYWVSTPLNLQLINACKSIKTFELETNQKFEDLDWSKLERKINKLKLRYGRYTTNIIEEIDVLRIFNSIYIEPEPYTNDDFNKLINFKLNNYKIIPSTTKSYTLKLINKID
ncbi:hypothetical protein CONCODRAFT_11349 [Conidiobolus coronatus NRRL 28638]|uniref:F-box domain-containing protein n=1 Tax=Conidiobolus coronatus (strain ATCC 28846 / CBS 209.66 / NRRL 28638) TaxID=796925 RepID=A0A137NVP6_CONC2|nr:hypothetical protein CONCODRAFT_11349 [Conidiobolus coronatus NRRL 28638]|eukprot:KXN66739.1 hypothetical protein CONCODRAFT_11349 [Conidiobolus coronatus NRRL 28638]